MLKNKKLKMLIVDDNIEKLLELEDMLKQPDIITVRAASGEEAFRHIMNHDFFLILINVNMPKMDGFETSELIRANKKFQHIPIIFLTQNQIQQNHVFKGYDLGTIDYLFKPVDPVILNSKIKVFIEIAQTNYRLKMKKILLNQKIKELTELKVLNYKLEKLSFYDSLTGINNRRRFDESLSAEWNRAIRNQSELSIIMIDVDNFKSYNDHYGHSAGDECLKKVANVLDRTVSRATDTVARYGGEEFTILLPDTNNYGAMNIAEKIRRNIEDLDIEHKYSYLYSKLTISLGVNSVVPTPKKYKDQFIENADRALYKAKDNKKNVVYNSIGM